MAADDRTSQDAAVIGDDLVEALGFEPISSESSEVAVLSEVGIDESGFDEVDQPIADDIEILDDPVVDDESTSEVETLDGDGLDSELADPESEVDAEDIADTDFAQTNDSDADSELSDEDESDEDESDSGRENDGSLFGAPAPWPSKASDDDDTMSLDMLKLGNGESEVDTDSAESDVDVDVDVDVDDSDSDSDSDPVVFFNNGVDTDTAPLADLNVPVDVEADLTEVESELIDLDGVDLDDIDFENALLEGADDVDSEGDDPEADSSFAEFDDDLRELDGQDAADFVDVVDPESLLDGVSLLDDDIGQHESSIDLTELDSADFDSTIESEAVSLLEAPVSVPGPPARDDLVENLESETTEIVAPETEPAIVAAPRRAKTRKKLRARKSRRVIRHIDPWSVLTFSVLFHLCFFAALLLASVLVWNAALAAGTIENIENFIRELGDYETFEINSDQVFRAAALIAGLLTLASSVLVVLLTVVFNLISDLIGGIRVTVIEEETVRIPTTAKK